MKLVLADMCDEGDDNASVIGRRGRILVATARTCRRKWVECDWKYGPIVHRYRGHWGLAFTLC